MIWTAELKAKIDRKKSVIINFQFMIMLSKLFHIQITDCCEYYLYHKSNIYITLHTQLFIISIPDHIGWCFRADQNIITQTNNYLAFTRSFDLFNYHLFFSFKTKSMLEKYFNVDDYKFIKTRWIVTLDKNHNSILFTSWKFNLVKS